MQEENVPQFTDESENNLHQINSSAAKIGKQTDSSGNGDREMTGAELQIPVSSNGHY
jgi:hypothetical protein